MRIAIISDSHDNLPNIYKALAWMNQNGVQEIIHCGDVCSAAALIEISKNFKGTIHFVYGNVSCDRETMEFQTQDIKNIVIYGDKGEIEIKKLRNKEIKKLKTGNWKLKREENETEGLIEVGFCHFPSEARKLAESGKYDYVFYGHTHKPWEEMVGKCKLLNPGTLAGMFYKATFAVWDTKKNRVDLKILELL